MHSCAAQVPSIHTSLEGICHIFDVGPRRIGGYKSLNQTVADERCGIRVLEQVIDEALHFRQRMPGRNFKTMSRLAKTYAQKTCRNAALLCSLYICCAHFCAYVPVCLGMLVASFGCVFSVRGLALKSSLLELPWLGLLGIMELSCSASAFLWFLCLIAIAHASQCSIATEHI